MLHIEFDTQRNCNFTHGFNVNVLYEETDGETTCEWNIFSKSALIIIIIIIIIIICCCTSKSWRSPVCSVACSCHLCIYQCFSDPMDFYSTTWMYVSVKCIFWCRRLRPTFEYLQTCEFCLRRRAWNCICVTLRLWFDSRGVKKKNIFLPSLISVFVFCLSYFWNSLDVSGGSRS